MRGLLTIAGKELRSSFVTPTAYVVIAGFLLVSGFFFFTLLNQYNTFLHQAALLPNIEPNLNEWVIHPYYQTIQIVLLFLIPILTMRSLAEEKQRGTFELLATSPLSVGDIVFGKFLGVAGVTVLMLGISFIFPGMLIVVADPEVAPIWVGFLGMVLFALSYVSLGIAVSAFTRSQTIAGVVSLVVMLLFFVIDAPASRIEGPVADVLSYLAPAKQADLFLKGVVEGANIVYFASVIVLGLFITARALEAQRWR